MGQDFIFRVCLFVFLPQQMWTEKSCEPCAQAITERLHSGKSNWADSLATASHTSSNNAHVCARNSEPWSSSNNAVLQKNPQSRFVVMRHLSYLLVVDTRVDVRAGRGLAGLACTHTA